MGNLFYVLSILSSPSVQEDEGEFPLFLLPGCFGRAPLIRDDPSCLQAIFSKASPSY